MKYFLKVWSVILVGCVALAALVGIFYLLLCLSEIAFIAAVFLAATSGMALLISAEGRD